MIHCIALGGRAKSGKTTGAISLAQYGYQRIGFADSLKLDVERIIFQHDTRLANAWRAAQAGDAKAKEIVRPHFILYGESKRAKDADYFVRPVLDRMAAHPGWKWVVDDLRYLNEAVALKRHEMALCVEIWRDLAPDIPTETVSLGAIAAAGMWDATIQNDSDIPALESALYDIAAANP